MSTAEDQAVAAPLDPSVPSARPDAHDSDDDDDDDAALFEGSRLSARFGGAGSADDDEDEGPPEPEWMDGPPQRRVRTTGTWVGMLSASVLVAAAAAVAWAWYAGPTPLECSAHQVHAQRFKIDVTELWTPRLSATLQLVLSVRNSNLLSSLLLDECRITVYEAATGLKLGSAQHGALHVSPTRTMQVNLALKQAGGSLPQSEQRRLSELFLRHKALILTIMATATSKLLTKGTETSPVTTNTTRRLDLALAAKDPFYQRAPPPPPPPDADGVHDVPL